MWWITAERVCARLTTPKVDVAAADRDLEVVLRASGLSSCGRLVWSNVQTAWFNSAFRFWARAIAGSWLSCDHRVRRRALGWMIAVAGTTTLFLQRFGEQGSEP